MFKKLSLAFALLMAGSTAIAEEFRLQYASFYDHLDQIAEEEYNLLEMRFSFINEKKRLCPIGAAEIRAPGYLAQPIILDAGEYLRLPYDKALDIEKAIVALDLESVHCQVKIQVTGKDTGKKQYSTEEVEAVYQQVALFMDDMGGMFSFLMPSAQGVVIHLDNQQQMVTASIGGEPMAIKDNKVYIPVDKMTQGKELILSHPSKIITPWMK